MKIRRDLIGLIDRILDYVFKGSIRARKGIGEIMGGQVLELESERLFREGREEGRTDGILAVATRMLQAGNYGMEEISKISGLSMEQIIEIKKNQNI